MKVCKGDVCLEAQGGQANGLMSALKFTSIAIGIGAVITALTRR